MEPSSKAGFHFRTWTVPLALLLVSLISFGVLSPWLGFYWDDWPAVWFLHLLGPSGFKEVFAIDRPLLGRLFMLTTLLLGESTLGWQLFGVITRWISSMALWWTLRSLWPQRIQQVTWITFLFAIYPGFMQQYIAVTYSHGWIILAAFLFSFGSMIWAVRWPRWFWPAMALSWLLSALIMFTDEYFFGLELLRPVILWLVLAGDPSPQFRSQPESLAVQSGLLAGLSESISSHSEPFAAHSEPLAGHSERPHGKRDSEGPSVVRRSGSGESPSPAQDKLRAGSPRRRVLRVLLMWLPFAAVMIVFLVWRLFLQDTPRGQVQIFDQLRSSPFAALFQLAQTILVDLFEVSLLAWVQTLNFTRLANLSLRLILVYAAIVISAASVTILYLGRFRPGTRKESQPHSQWASPNGANQPEPDSGRWATKRWALQAILIGLLALLLGGWPFWATSLPIKLKFPWDRFTLSMMLGACLLFVGLLELLLRSRMQKVLILGAAVGLAAGMHFQDGLVYRREWNAQKDFFWQLTWRAPGIRPGTALLTAGLPFAYYTDNSLTGPLNWVYAPDLDERQMPYLLYDLEVRLGLTLAGLEKGLPIEQPYRATTFRGSTSQALVLYDPPEGCLQVLDPLRDSQLPIKEKLIQDAMPLSDPGNILSNPEVVARPPIQVFGPEPDHGWCYYYEKAELARQEGRWQQVADLGEQAFQLAARPANPAELLPFIEGYAQVSNWNRAEELTHQAYQANTRLQAALCATWDRIEQNTPADTQQQVTLRQIKGRLQCANP